MEKQNKQLTEEEKIKRIAKLALELTRCQSRGTLEELFDLTGDKDFIRRAIEIENPTGILYPRYGAMGGCDFGYFSSGAAARLAEKMGDTSQALTLYRQARDRLNTFREWSQSEPGKWRKWGYADEQSMAEYCSKIAELGSRK